MSAGYTVAITSDVSLSAATAKSVMSVVAGANITFKLIEFHVGFDGVNPVAEPVTVELCTSTQAGAGTSTSHTVQQVRGPARTAQCTAARNFTVEPTVLTAVKCWLIHPTGSLTIQYPLGREVEKITAAAGAILLRCTAPAAVNLQGYMEWEEG